MHKKRTAVVRVLVGLGAIAVLGLLVASLDFRRDLHSVNASLLSGSPEGNYHAIAERLSQRVAAGRGKLANVVTAGSVDNLNRLAAAARDCQVQFALIQDGQDWPAKAPLELVGRLPRPESVLFLGRGADALTELSTLAGKRIGTGPSGSGTERIARQLFSARELAELGTRLETHTLAEQLDLAAKGELDLAMFVIDQDAPLVTRAVSELGLQVAGFARAEVLAGRVPHLSLGRIPAGYYDAVRVLPPSEKPVLQVATLVVGNDCSGRSETIGLLKALSAELPSFIRANREATNATGLELTAASKSFFDNEGPEIFDEWAPWLVNIMPPGKWVYLVTALSLLFNAMGFGHRFQLWRIDVNRVRLENELTKRFGATVTLGDIARLEPDASHRTPELLDGVRAVIRELEALAARSRRQSLSILVPMGQEMSYRYQESLIHETLAVLRAFVRRAER